MTTELPHDDHRLDAALADFLKRRDEGIEIDRESFLRSHPEIADSLRDLLEAADCIEHMAGPTFAEAAAQQRQSMGQRTESGEAEEAIWMPPCPRAFHRVSRRLAMRIPRSISKKPKGVPIFLVASGRS